MTLPKILLDAMSVHINHNQHKDYYEPIKRYLDEGHIKPDDVLPEDREQILATDSIWEVQWYPVSPIGFYYVAAASLERCFQIIEEGKWE